MPLGFEFINDGTVSESSLLLVGSVYALSIGVSSEHLVLFAYGILIGFILAISLGTVEVSVAEQMKQGDVQSKQPFYTSPAFFAVLSIMIFYTVERYFRHVQDDQAFFKFDIKPKTGSDEL
jgi:hypothetical protein